MKWRGISTDSAEQQDTPRLLRDKLIDIKAGIAEYVRPENQAVNERAVSAIRASGIEQRILPVGAVAPEFTLEDQNSKRVSSADLLAKGPLILNFFRGRWCPFCSTTLESWRDISPQVEAAGASIVAISPQTVRHNFFLADQHKLRFPVLSDPGLAIARRFGIVYSVPEEQRAMYKAVFINLPQVNGDDSWELPLPATFVIGPDSKVLFSFASADYTLRAGPEEVLKSLTH